MRNININGSPFSVNVTGRMDFGKVGKVMACFGCEGTGGGKPDALLQYFKLSVTEQCNNLLIYRSMRDVC